MHFPKIGDFLLLTPIYRRLAELDDLEVTVIVPDPLITLFERWRLLPRTAVRAHVDPTRGWDRVIDASPVRPGPIPFAHETLRPRPGDPPVHMSVAYARALRELFPALDAESPIEPYLDIDPDERRLKARGLELFSYYTVHGGSDYAPKNWPRDHFRAFVTAVHTDFPRLRCVEIIGPSDRPLFDETDRPPWCVPVRTTLDEVAHVLAGATFHVDNDSGVHHLAGVLDVPTISVWGPTGPGSWSSLTRRNFVHWGGPACVDHCGGARVETCAERVCLTSVRPEELLTSARRILSAYAMP
jgi:ADP-heptose:LPS heptosyltransferase